MTIEELKSMLLEMDIPKLRMELKKSNTRWLLRNLAVRNKDHTNFKDVFEKLKELT